MKSDLFATGSVDKAVRLWTLTDPAHPRALPRAIPHGGTVRALALHSRGAMVAVAGGQPSGEILGSVLVEQVVVQARDRASEHRQIRPERHAGHRRVSLDQKAGRRDVLAHRALLKGVA
ncbi:hypothetical protein ACFORH_11185 [Amycolatopsis roodepoortensis]|uniref:hypothetical protein n=1 Tax=Amycolatopsis roodepoortensis TaxID=700274 RepID=UPI0036235079